MESFVDISTLTIEEVTGTLRAADEVDTPPPPTLPQASVGKLLLTEEQWLDRYKQKDGDSGRGGATSGGRGSAVASRAAGEARALLRGQQLGPGQPGR